MTPLPRRARGCMASRPLLATLGAETPRIRSADLAGPRVRLAAVIAAEARTETVPAGRQSGFSSRLPWLAGATAGLAAAVAIVVALASPVGAVH